MPYCFQGGWKSRLPMWSLLTPWREGAHRLSKMNVSPLTQWPLLMVMKVEPVFFMVFNSDRQLLSKNSFCLAKLPSSWSFGYRELAFSQGIFLFIPIGVFRVVASLVLSVRYKKYEERLRNSLPCLSLSPKISDWRAFFSSPFRVFLLLFYV